MAAEVGRVTFLSDRATLAGFPLVVYSPICIWAVLSLLDYNNNKRTWTLGRSQETYLGSMWWGNLEENVMNEYEKDRLYICMRFGKFFLILSLVALGYGAHEA